MHSQVNWTRQLALAILLFVLGGAAYWYEFSARPRREETEEKSKKPFALDKNAAVQTLIFAEGSRTFEFDCLDLSAKLCKAGDNSRWELRQPVKAKADDGNANSALSGVANLASVDVIDLKDETLEKRAALLREYGLDEPARKSAAVRRVSARTPEGEIVAFLGALHPIDDGNFAVVGRAAPGKGEPKVDENTVYVLPSYFRANFDHDLSYWREKRILTLAANEISAFTLASPDKGTLSGERLEAQNREWQLKIPAGKGHPTAETVPGDLEAIDTLLSAAVNLQAKSFVAESKNDEKSRAALKDGKTALTLKLQPQTTAAAGGKAAATPEPVTLTLIRAAKGDKLYATVSTLDPVYELETNSRERLDKSARDLRQAKLLTSIQRFSVKRMEFSGAALGAGPLVIADRDGRWVREDAPAKTSPVDTDKVQSLLDKLSTLKIQEFLSGAAVPAGDAGALRLKLQNPDRTLVFWKAGGGKLYARIEAGASAAANRREAFVMDPQLTEVLPTTRTFFDPKPATAVSPGPSGVPKGANSAPVPAPAPVPAHPAMPAPKAGK